MDRKAAVPKFVILIEMLLFAGAFNAAEWSRTITPREGHKALNLARLPVPPQPLEGRRF
jgi:hypothetical protein